MAPFPEDWAIGHDQMGEVYYYNKFSMKVISVHPMSEYFLDAIDDARKRDKEERELAEEKGEEILVDDSAFWMRFGTLHSDECYYYNFDTNLLHSEAQYKHVIELQLEDRRKRVQKERDEGGKDASAVKKMQEELASKRALQSMFARGVKKMFIQWVMYVMEMRLQQTKALQKLGSIAGQNEASSFRQWKQRNQELLKVSQTARIILCHATTFEFWCACDCLDPWCGRNVDPFTCYTRRCGGRWLLLQVERIRCW